LSGGFFYVPLSTNEDANRYIEESMRESVFCIALLIATCLTACSNKTAKSGSDNDSASSIENVAKMMEDNASVDADSLADMGLDKDPAEGAPVNNEEWDVNMRNNPEVDRAETRIVSHYIANDGKTKVYSAYYWQKDGNIQQVGETWEV